MASETWVPAEAGRVQLTGVGGTSSQALAKETGASFSEVPRARLVPAGGGRPGQGEVKRF